MIQNAQEALIVRSPTPTAATPEEIELSGRVLLAEDGPDNQRFIAFVLKKAGAEVTLAENGQIAYDETLAAVVQGRPFDVILMDMQMPVLDGYEATRQLREQGYTGPIIALTAHAMATDRQKCMDAGCDDFANKPIERQNLLSTVAHWMAPGRTNESSPIGELLVIT
ncbi:MAG: response regulator [Planctomycetota bacterium]